jgi:hypothetical protein
VTSQAVSLRIRPLEAAGLVVRHRDADDRRRTVLRQVVPILDALAADLSGRRHECRRCQGHVRAFEEASETEEWHRFERLFLPSSSARPKLGDPCGACGVDRVPAAPSGVFARAGASGTRLAGLEVVPLDAIHVLARTTWDVLYDDPHDPVTLRSSFLVRHTEDGWRIAVYLNHESLLELLGGGATRPREPPTAGVPARDVVR